MSDRPRLLPIGKGPLLALLFAISAAWYGSAAGQEFCSEPVPPYCVNEDSEFDSMVQINRCEEDMNEFEQQLDEYEQCIADQLKGMRSDLSKARKRLVKERENF